MVNAKNSFNDRIKNSKTVFIILAIALIIIELQIFAFAAIKSGRRSWLQVMDDSGNVIYETEGSYLSNFNKYYFEKTFGSFDNFQSRLVTKETEFPFRAWFTAAIGVPIGIILLYGLIVKAYIALFYNEKEVASHNNEGGQTGDHQILKLLQPFSQLNIFTIGFLVLIAVFAYWVVPNFISYISKIGIETFIRFKWWILSGFIIVIGLFAWIIYLKYLLAKESLEKQTEMEKFRLSLAYDKNSEHQLRIDHNTVEDAQIEGKRENHKNNYRADHGVK